MPSMPFLPRLLPGLLLCILVTVLAGLLQWVEVRLAGEPYLEALVLAILLGVGIRTVWTPGSGWHSGIAFSPAQVASGSGTTAVTLTIATPDYPVGPFASLTRTGAPLR